MPSKNDPPPSRPLALVDASFPGQPAYDTAVNHALLRQVAAGQRPETLRLYSPDEGVLFSVLDRRNPGFVRAIAAARARGCPSLLRLAGGSAALFHPQCLAFAWAIPETRSADGIRARFQTVTALMQRALERVGVDARIGAVADEYCPGEFSINAEGRIKLLGIGQRVIRGAAHVGGVLVVRDAARVREVLAPVYRALGQAFDPRTAGAVEDCAPGISLEEMRRAVCAELAAGRPLAQACVEPATHALAQELHPAHALEPGTAVRAKNPLAPSQASDPPGMGKA